MRLRELPFQADENFDPDVVAHLRADGWDVVTARESGLLGKSDEEVLRHSVAAGRAVLTHDGDFGGLVVAGKEPVIGIVYLRPGHIRPEFTLATIAAVVEAHFDIEPPFILVARQRSGRVSVRVRSLARP